MSCKMRPLMLYLYNELYAGSQGNGLSDDTTENDGG